MDLDDRIKKIATGMNVSDAIDSYMQQLSEEEQPSDPEEEHTEELLAIVEVMFLMAAVDGEVSDEEVDELRASVHALTDLRVVAPIRLEQMVESLGDKLARDGWQARLREAASRIRAPEARSFAFQLAAGVAFVDDFVAHAEAAAIDSLAQAFEIDEEESQNLLREVHATLFEG